MAVPSKYLDETEATLQATLEAIGRKQLVLERAYGYDASNIIEGTARKVFQIALNLKLENRSTTLFNASKIIVNEQGIKTTATYLIRGRRAKIDEWKRGTPFGKFADWFNTDDSEKPDFLLLIVFDDLYKVLGAAKVSRTVLSQKDAVREIVLKGKLTGDGEFTLRPEMIDLDRPTAGIERMTEQAVEVLRTTKPDQI